MWFLESLDPGSAIYNQLHAFRIRGPVNPGLLERSLGEVMARHESLRTNLFVADGLIYQRVLPPAAPDFRFIDLGAAGPEGSLDEARRRLIAVARKPFDLASEPLVRPHMIMIAPDDFLLGLITHHTIMDGWSARILIRELAAIYEDLAQGRAPGSSLPPPAIPYADYAARQRERFDAGDYDRQLDHWLKVLDGDLPVLALPTDHRRSASQPYEGRAFTVTLPSTMTASLKALGRKEKATLFMTLLAAYYVLLHRYTGQDDIVVGCPVAGRNELDTEGIIGLFVNTLPLRSKVAPGDTFLALLRQVKATALEAYDNQDLPFEKLVERLAVPRLMDRSPVFQTLFQLRNFPGPVAALAGHPVERIEFEEVVAKTDMTLEVTETDDGLLCRFEYPVALFEEETVARMAGHWRTLLDAIVADPSKEVSRLRLLTEEEHMSILALGRGPRNEYPRDATVVSIFEARARASPDSLAVIDGREHITYRELDERASRLAGKLRTMGVIAEEPVALLMERSAALATAMLAILKAGGAYVPLDPGDADARLAGIVEATRAKVLLADAGLVSRATGLATGAVIVDPVGHGEISGEAPAGGTLQGSGSLAYIMFTSGSTGRPKGVCIPHRGILRLVINTDFVTLARGDVVGHLSSPAFDAATFDVWGPLLNGATLAIIDRDTALSPAALVEKIDENRINVLFLPTPLFHALAAETPSCFRRIRDLLVGGDLLQPVPAKAVLRDGPPGKLLNVYGPTENTTFSTWYQVKEVADREEPIPLGRPIANDYLYILDPELQPVPIGVIGEIYLGGDGVATGYLRRPDLTAERFLPDPFRPGEGRTMYRTGDLARYFPDGNVQFIGRRDGQAKIHGFRVETGEVALALESHPGVRTAIVTVFNDPGGFKSLAAYLLKAADTTASIGDVRRYLAGRLPAYMVPASMMWIDAVPLTPRGKIDRSALPDPVIGLAPGLTPPTPGNDGDRALSQMVTVWESVLGAGHVGPDDDFFDLGGHSLLAIRLMDRIEESFGVRLPISAIFGSPTARKMRASLGEAGKARAGNVLIPLQAEGTRQPLYCVHGVPGTLFEFDHLVRQIGKDQPVYGLQSPGLDGVTRVPDTVEAMASLYVEVIRSHQSRGPYHFISYCAGGPFAYEVARQFISAGEKVGFLGFIDYPAPGQEIRSIFWSCYRYLCDNSGGAAAHLGRFGRAGIREKATSLLALPGFLARKALNLPAEVATSPADMPGADAASASAAAPYPDWVMNLGGVQQAVTMKNYDAVRRYYPAAYEGKVTIFISSERVQSSRRSGKYERTFGWKRLARGGVRRYILGGNHSSILSLDNFKRIAHFVRDGIDESGGAGSGHGR
jgi:amino acid adenylation domain-containing protein